MPEKIRCVVRKGTIWTVIGTGVNRLLFVKLSPGRKGKIQSAGGRGDAGKKAKNEGTKNTGEMLGHGERNEETNEEEETPNRSGQINK